MKTGGPPSTSTALAGSPMLLLSVTSAVIQMLSPSEATTIQTLSPSKEARARSDTDPALAVSPKAEQTPPSITNDKQTGAILAPERDNFTNTNDYDPPATSGTKDVDGIGRGNTAHAVGAITAKHRKLGEVSYHLLFTDVNILYSTSFLFKNARMNEAIGIYLYFYITALFILINSVHYILLFKYSTFIYSLFLCDPLSDNVLLSHGVFESHK